MYLTTHQKTNFRTSTNHITISRQEERLSFLLVFDKSRDHPLIGVNLSWNWNTTKEQFIGLFLWDKNEKVIGKFHGR